MNILHLEDNYGCSITSLDVLHQCILAVLGHMRKNVGAENLKNMSGIMQQGKNELTSPHSCLCLRLVQIELHCG